MKERTLVFKTPTDAVRYFDLEKLGRDIYKWYLRHSLILYPGVPTQLKHIILYYNILLYHIILYYTMFHYAMLYYRLPQSARDPRTADNNAFGPDTEARWLRLRDPGH